MTVQPRFSEDTRQLVHMAMGGFALLLRYIPSWVAAILAATAIAFNVYALPRWGRHRIYRASDVAHGVPAGILLYPLSILILVLAVPNRPDIVASAWGILAIGDGMANIVGRRVGGVRIPWNREKTIAGSLALVVFGGAAGALLAWWCRPAVIPPPYLWFSLGAPFAAALAAAAVETIPVRLDDNVSVPLSAAGVLWGFSLMSEDLLVSSWHGAPAALPLALAANAAVAWIGYRVRTVSTSGAIGGAIIGTIIFASTGWRGWVLLLITFVAATAASQLGLKRKTLLGIAEQRGGRRGAGNAVANTGVAACAALLAALTYAREPALIAFVAALAAGGSDTIASEIGKAWGRNTFLFPRFRPVAPGTSGAVSLEGTAAGIVGALALSAAGAALGVVPSSAILPVVAAATAGSFAESALAATLEGPGILNNDLLNFLNTFIAAFLAILIIGAGF
jgi:uncharacterized protein (TIGR00297 family)